MRAAAVVFALAVSACGARAGAPGEALGGGVSGASSAKDVRASSAPGITSATLAATPGDVDFFESIPSAEHWRRLRALPGSAHLARTEVVKFLLDRTDGRVYFTQTERWPIHFDFAKKFLSTPSHPVEDHGAFNRREYHDPDRRFIVGSLAHYLDAGVYAFELLPSDELDLALTARAFDSVRRLVFFGAELRFRPVSAAHEGAIIEARALMPVVTGDEIYGTIRYQPLELGESYGYLRVIPRASAKSVEALSSRDIAVLEELPEEVPAVAGVISAQIQAPLGHINVLCHNRRTPNMALRGALSDPRVAGFKDKLVHLVVEGQSFRIEAATEADAARSWEASAPPDVVKPRRDDRDVGMPLLTDPRARDASFAGAKAAQLALAAKDLPPSGVPRAFVLPFHAYARFLRVNGLDRRIDQALSSPGFAGDPARRRGELAGLRAAMESAPVPSDMVKSLIARIKATLPPGVVRLRSSTNAEDLPGFNGAGLYRSAKVVDPSSEAEVEAALRRVWSSVWLPGAFEERELYHIDHRAVGMAILVQESIEDIKASGVAITANPFNQGQPGYFINAQAPEGSVTGARGDEVPEQILYYTFEGGRGVERVSRSSRSKDRDLLSAAEVEELAGHLSIVHTSMGGSVTGLGARAADVEFLVAKTGRVIIVQARPYTMRWDGDRRWSVTFE